MATAATAGMDRRRTPLDAVLSLFTQVRPGEGLTAILLTVDVFLILSSYYMLKPVREALIVPTKYGAVAASYSSALQAVLLLGAVPLYASLAARFPRRRLINTVTLFFIACLLLFYLFSRWHFIAIVFFVWLGIFNMMIVAQFWSFANDLYTVEQGKRLFALVAFGGSAGAVLGAYITGPLLARLGVAPMMLVAAAGLGVSLALTNLIDLRERRSGSQRRAGHPGDRARAETGHSEEAIGGGGGAFRLVFSNRYLLLIAFLMLLLNWVNTNGEFILRNTVKQMATAAVAAGSAGGLSEGQVIGRFYSGFYTVVNLAGLVVQLFLVSRIIRIIGVSRALLVLPVIAFASYAVLAFIPILSAVRFAKTAENSLDYSLNNTVRQALFLPTSRQAKYKAKQAIDSFFVRTGDVLSAGLVFVGTTWLALTTTGFAIANLVLVAVWIALAILIGREYHRIQRREAERTAIPRSRT